MRRIREGRWRDRVIRGLGWLDRRRLDWAGTRAFDSLGAWPSLMTGPAEGGRHPVENSRLALALPG